MRDLLSLSLCALCVLFLASPVIAEEEPPAPKAPVPEAKKEAEKIVVPGYSAEDMICQTTDLPEGWTTCPAEETLPAVVVSEDALMMLGVGVGYDEDTLFVESRALKKEGAIATVAIVDIDASPMNYRKALTEKAATNKWTVKELGSPMRLLVVWGSSEETAKAMTAWQHEIAVTRLAESAWAKLLERSVHGQDEALKLLGAAQKVEPKAGVLGAIQGFMLQQQDPAKSLEVWRYSLKQDTPAPPRGKLRLLVGFNAAQAMLTMKSEGTLEGDVYDETVAILEEAIANEKLWDLEKGGRDTFNAFGNRYNLACTYARMGKIDAGLKVLRESLEFGKKHMEADMFAQAYNHMVNTDSDMDPFKENEAYKKIVADFAPGGGSDG